MCPVAELSHFSTWESSGMLDLWIIQRETEGEAEVARTGVEWTGSDRSSVKILRIELASLVRRDLFYSAVAESR